MADQIITFHQSPAGSLNNRSYSWSGTTLTVTLRPKVSYRLDAVDIYCYNSDGEELQHHSWANLRHYYKDGDKVLTSSGHNDCVRIEIYAQCSSTTYDKEFEIYAEVDPDGSEGNTITIEGLAGTMGQKKTGKYPDIIFSGYPESAFTVRLTANPGPGMTFDHWDGGPSSSAFTFYSTEQVIEQTHLFPPSDWGWRGFFTYRATFFSGEGCVVRTRPNLKERGSTSPTEKNVKIGTSVTVTATPNVGYRFVEWSDGSTDASHTLTPTEDVELVAYFELEDDYFEVTTRPDDPSHGTTTPTRKAVWYKSSVTVTATPADGWRFVRWSDGSTDQSHTFTPTESVELVAYFVAPSGKLLYGSAGRLLYGANGALLYSG